MHLVMLPEEFIAFRNEVNEHPWLCQKLSKVELDKDPHMHFIRMIAEVAAELNIPVDGDFSQEEVRNLCDDLTMELRKRRSSILVVQQ